MNLARYTSKESEHYSGSHHREVEDAYGDD
jgi:hypothetical protein